MQIKQAWLSIMAWANNSTRRIVSIIGNPVQRIGPAAFLQQNGSLHLKIIIPFTLLIVVALMVVGYSSFQMSKKNTALLIEKRLEMEAKVIPQKIAILKAILDDKAFNKRLKLELQQQKAALAQQGLNIGQFTINLNKQVENLLPGKELLALPPELAAEILKKENGVKHYRFKGKNYTLAFSKAHEMQKIYVVAVKEQDYLAPIFQSRNVVVVTMLISAILAVIIGWLLVRSITGPVQKLLDVILTVGKGDLTPRINFRTGRTNELGELMQSFNAMLDKISAMVYQLKDTTNDLRIVGGELQEAAQKTEHSARDLGNSVAVVKAGAEQTAAATEKTCLSFAGMKETIMQLLHKIGDAQRTGLDMEAAAKAGQVELQNLLKLLSYYSDAIEKLNKRMEDLERQSSRIENIVNLIDTISSQTKLLALNASIEAARAGSAGRSFAVVAKEVQKLAEESAQAVTEITQVVGAMQEHTANAFASTRQFVHEVEGGREIARKSEEKFAELLAGISYTSREIVDMNTEITGISESLAQVNSLIDGFTAVTQEALASAEEVEQVSQEQVRMAGQANALSAKLVHISAGLECLTGEFVVS